MRTLTLTLPDDAHLHLRDAPFTASLMGHVAANFGRAIIMPNLLPPITKVAQALEYRRRILAALPPQAAFEPLMTLYLTQETSVQELQAAATSPHLHGVKLYPAGATTNSASGVQDLKQVYPLLEEMQKLGLPLLLHGEVTDPQVDIFDREKVFLERSLAPLCRDFPALKMVLEHVTTKEGVDFVTQAPPQLAASLTLHHLVINRNDLLVGGMRPHHFCLPIAKREEHRQALLKAATSGNPKFFLGTDSAPHPKRAKESACGCAGIYTAHLAMPFFAWVFEQQKALDKLEAFASHFAADFYGLPRNQGSLTLLRQEQQIPPELDYGSGESLVPFWAGQSLPWSLAPGAGKGPGNQE